MASRDLSTLISEVRDAAVLTKECCHVRGFELLIYCTFRPFEEQARLYRQSRRRAQILRKAERLRARGFPELADILIGVGPQEGIVGRHVTGAGPGESWHQYRRAFDAVPLVGGKAEWSASSPHWQTYGQCAVDAGLEWAGNWTRFKEYPHAQKPSTVSNPLEILTHHAVSQALEYNKRFNSLR